MSLARFLRDARGGVAPLLALSIVPLMGGIGVAIDYSRAAAARAAMQNAIDATALMLSRDAPNLADDAALTAKANEYFNSIFQQPYAKNASVTAVKTEPAAGNFKLTVTGSATVDPVFVQVIGIGQFNIGTSAEVVWGMKKLNLALALDNTGSMASNSKMTELKKAAKSLLATLQKAEKTPGDVKVSIIPFAVDVNVGTDKVNEPWIDWTHWDTENGSCSKSSYDSYSECVSKGKVWTPKSHSEWNGCVKDRDQNHDVLNTATGDSAATKYRAHQASSCPTAMMPLSSDWAKLNEKIDAMVPTGNTNVTIGMQMAWQTLTDNAPFNAPAPDDNLDKVIILLTDGENTQNRWTSSSSSIDARTQKVCANAKAANIKVYTVRVINGNRTLLRNCASKPDMYYEVNEAVQLNTVFSSIAQNLANLRIVK